MKKRRSKDETTASGDEKQSSKVTLEEFFSMSVSSGKLKSWQFKEIETFFLLDNRLQRKEDLDTYQKILEKY